MAQSRSRGGRAYKASHRPCAAPAATHAPAVLPLLVALDLSPERPIRTNCAPPWRPNAGDVGADMHYGLEFGVIVSGCVHRNHGSGWFRVGVGQAWATASLEMHQWRVGRNMRHVAFQFLPALLEQLPVLDGFDVTAPFRVPNRLNAIGRRRRFRRALAGLARELLPKYQDDVPPGDIFFDMLQLLKPISAEVLQGSDPAERRLGSRSRLSIMPATDLVQQATDRVVSIDEAAEACRMTRRTFCRSFRTVMGISYGEFALRWRLACAAHMLKSTDGLVKAIAYRFGFNGPSHFHRAFTARYGMSPSRYRATARLSVL